MVTYWLSCSASFFLSALALPLLSSFQTHFLCPVHIGLQPIRRRFARGVPLGNIMVEPCRARKRKVAAEPQGPKSSACEGCKGCGRRCFARCFAGPALKLTISGQMRLERATIPSRDAAPAGWLVRRRLPMDGMNKSTTLDRPFPGIP